MSRLPVNLPRSLEFFNELPANKIRQFVDTAYLHDMNNLLVPYEYDCLAWGDHPYFKAVPSRYLECARQKMLASLGYQQISTPFWVVDEEVFECSTILEAVLESSKNNRAFVIFEIGARWGTWGAKSLAASKILNLPAMAVYYEPETLHCEAIHKVHQLNDFTNYHLRCEKAEARIMEMDILQFHPIDVMDFDIQGDEASLLPAIAHLIDKHVRTLIIGTHSPEIHMQMENLFSHWNIIHRMPYSHNTSCVVTYFRNQYFGDVLENGCYTETRFGPICNWDGELILKNPLVID